MRIIIYGELKKIEHRCAMCGKWVAALCEDHPEADVRVYESYELDDSMTAETWKQETEVIA